MSVPLLKSSMAAAPGCVCPLGLTAEDAAAVAGAPQASGSVDPGATGKRRDNELRRGAGTIPVDLVPFEPAGAVESPPVSSTATRLECRPDHDRWAGIRDLLATATQVPTVLLVVRQATQ